MPKRDYLSRKEYNAWMRERTTRIHIQRRLWALELLGGRCVSCRTREELEFDHVNPATKSFNIGQHLGKYSEKKLEEELAKCQLLCKDCHRKKTGVAEHGTRPCYTGGCRCEACTEANKLYYRDYWTRKQTAEA